jgi:predicted HTH domain antitoxin
MREAIFQVRIPAELLEYGFQPNEIQRHVTEWLVLSLFKDGHISSGKAAKLLNVTRVEFLSLLRRRGIAYIDFTPEELAEELDAVASLPVVVP